jgi:hypothetical protein
MGNYGSKEQKEQRAQRMRQGHAPSMDPLRGHKSGAQGSPHAHIGQGLTEGQLRVHLRVHLAGTLPSLKNVRKLLAAFPQEAPAAGPKQQRAQAEQPAAAHGVDKPAAASNTTAVRRHPLHERASPGEKLVFECPHGEHTLALISRCGCGVVCFWLRGCVFRLWGCVFLAKTLSPFAKW